MAGRVSLRPRLASIWLAAALLAAGLSVTGATPAAGATFVITKAADTADGVCDADCSLREAIMAANGTAGVDTIVVPPGVYKTAIGGTDEVGALGDHDITETVTIEGPWQTCVFIRPECAIIDGGFNTINQRVFEVHAPAGLTLSGVTIQNGIASGTRGGGIFVRPGASLALARVTMQNNSAGTNGGNIDVDGTATISDSLIQAGYSLIGGGNISIDGTASLTNVTLFGGSANGSGGSLRNAGTTTLNNVTLVKGEADSDANGTGDGGGVSQQAGTLTVMNSILAGNTDSSPGTVRRDCGFLAGSLVSLGHNLVQDPGNCTFAGPGDILGQDPKLGDGTEPSAATVTLPLLTGSPAINAGDPATPGSGGTTCPATDQRGAPRKGRCDIGAYELVRCFGTVVSRVGSPGRDRITAGSGVLGLGGNDTLIGKVSDDGLCGGPGKDKLKGKDGEDGLDGGPGKDRCIGGPADDRAKSCEREKQIP